MKKAVVALALLVVVALLSANVNTVAHAQGDLVAPSNVAAQNTGNPGEVRISWDAVPNAAYYRIGWVAYRDVEPIIASGGDWLERFAFIDIQNHGQTQHTIRRLTPGVQYAFIVASNDGRYGTPRWPGATGWRFLNLAQASASQAATGTASVNVTWYAVPGASYYRIGWVVYSDVQPIIDAGGDWLEHFAFIDIANRGQTAHMIERLTPGLQYAFIVAGNDGRYGTPQWPDASGWQFMTPGEDQPACPIPGMMPVPGPVDAVGGDYDADDDGLIDVATLAQLDAIRHYHSAYSAPSPDRDKFYEAFPNAAERIGCPRSGCRGFELVADLDFDTNGNGRADAGDAYWNSGTGWFPITNISSITFDGGGHTISNLFINRLDGFSGGLFGSVNIHIRNVALTAVNITTAGTAAGLIAGSGGSTSSRNISGICVTGVVKSTRSNAGGLLGSSGGSRITNSFAAVDVIAQRGAGGLVGLMRHGSISDSYATGDVTGGNAVGGLIGSNGKIEIRGGPNSGFITGSYATGTVIGGSSVGGLVGYSHGRTGNLPVIENSYATGDVLGDGNDVGGLVGHNSGKIRGTFATGSVSGRGNVGGLLGRSRTYVYSGQTVSGSVAYSYAFGTVSGGDNVGGLVGYSDSAGISNSYASGSVESVGTHSGGLVGLNGGSVSSAYSRGLVSGNSQVGGLIGTSLGIVSASYWDIEASAQAASDGGEGKTTRELQSETGYTGIYRSWRQNFFPSRWDFGTSSQYPVLKYGILDPVQQRR